MRVVDDEAQHGELTFISTQLRYQIETARKNNTAQRRARALYVEQHDFTHLR